MNLFDRFILTIYSLALTVLSIIAIGIITRVIDPSYVQYALNSMYNAGSINIPYLIVAVIFLVISVRFIFSAFPQKRAREEKGIYQRTETGMVTISVDTIKSIAERTGRKVRGVRDLDTKVRTTESGNVILVKITVDGETPIPEMTQTLQKEIKHQVETIAGVEIAEVTIVVSEVVSRENVAGRTRMLD
ncbi:alkaline shock response membrane anchor protein AmaP [Brevibacillus daliensis]|uniref:alkaline shock response membrane anchor protein AmaP n=1 Tax=Brevibacillus daliensis TaxID=2892995 RepID=UPI001E4CF9F3|nr:alkaline shock response membrane anchor protein AmaP [Brevibacillus daliensis]